MDNYTIADQLSLLAKLMDIHGENSFKSKSYASAAFAIEKLPQELSKLSPEKLFAVKGIGESVGKKILELLQTGEIAALQEIIAITPEGVMEMMNIKGLGPKKINTIWKELNIDSIDDLKLACQENKISEKKGFGEKTQQKILEEINFKEKSQGSYLYAQIENFAEAFDIKLKKKFPDELIEMTGEYRRQLEIITNLECVTTISTEKLKDYLLHHSLQIVAEENKRLTANAEGKLELQFHLASKEDFHSILFQTSASKDFLTHFPKIETGSGNEEAIFKEAGLPYIPPFLREHKEIITSPQDFNLNDLIQTNEIKGLIHSHSDWSDGAHTIEQMAKELISLGFEYLVISDHSKAAFYANGLSEQKIKEQHKYIEKLNEKFAPFKIYKSIECDILSDGSLDYENEVLKTFDLVIVSIHSNLQMDEEKAMKRLLGAIQNPYTTILGHMTGRRLLKRKGYRVDHKTIIDACAENNVVIEINANPQRLDMEWQWVNYALKKNVMLSINPDAHTTDEFQNLKYGVLVAQKGGLSKKQNLSSFSQNEFEDFLISTKKKKGII